MNRRKKKASLNAFSVAKKTKTKKIITNGSRPRAGFFDWDDLPSISISIFYQPDLRSFLISKQHTMSQEKFETSKTSGAHYKLGQMAGEWEGTTYTYFEEGKPPVDESPMSGSIQPIMDGRFMLHIYKGIFQGKPFDGLAIYSYYMPANKFQCAWIDSFHMGTGIMFSEATQSDSKLFEVLGSYEGGGETWGWRTEITMPDNDQLIIKAYNMTPAGEPAGGVETRYRRRKTTAD
jgi:hypothetical protein